MQTAHSSQDNFNKMITINRAISCGGKYLEEQQGMHPTPHQMISPISWRQSEWADELQANKHLDAPFFSLMAYKCTDIATLKELSFFVIGWKMDHLLNISWEVSL